MKEIVVISGKGGTGKTSVTASFAYLGEKDMVLADCDVDASDMHILLEPELETKEDFHSSQAALIDIEKCKSCGKCIQICRFNAIEVRDGKYIVSDPDCEGCGYCARVCPADAIELRYRKDGEFLISDTRLGKKLFHASLGPGAENSGKLVTKVKLEAKKYAIKNSIETVLVDGSPGVGCPVIASLSGASYVITVTEPTLSGFHDLKRVLELIEKFRIPSGCIINKSDINPGITEKIKNYLDKKNIPVLTVLPYSSKFTHAMLNGKTVPEFDKELGNLIKEAWDKTIKSIN